MGKECEPDTPAARGEERTGGEGRTGQLCCCYCWAMGPGLENKQLPSEVLSSNIARVWNKNKLQSLPKRSSVMSIKPKFLVPRMRRVAVFLTWAVKEGREGSTAQLAGWPAS